jgi:hypothetical protein
VRDMVDDIGLFCNEGVCRSPCGRPALTRRLGEYVRLLPLRPQKPGPGPWRSSPVAANVPRGGAR